MDPRTTWPALLNALLNGQSLSADETAWAMNEIMSGQATDVQIAGFAVALRAKGETVAEVSGLATGMLAHATPITVPGPASTSSAPAATGPTRSTSPPWARSSPRPRAPRWSSTATAPRRPPAAPPTCWRSSASSSTCRRRRPREVAGEVGITFCFAPLYHPALRYAARTRSELGTPTVFNFLGPLTNPATPHRPGGRRLPSRAWPASPRASSPSAAAPRWCSAATTASTS